MRARYKPWAKPFIDENKNIILRFDDIEASSIFKDFISSNNLYLEIGSGKGKFMTSLAAKHPDLKFLCIEKVESVAAQFAKLVKANKLENILIVCEDFEKIFPSIKRNSVSTIFLNHPDPWPKKRHWKKRLTSLKFLNEYKDILKKDGLLILKTDNDDMFSYSIEQLKICDWNITYLEYNYKDDDEFDALTNYEENWQKKGVKIKRLKATYMGDK